MTDFYRIVDRSASKFLEVSASLAAKRTKGKGPLRTALQLSNDVAHDVRLIKKSNTPDRYERNRSRLRVVSKYTDSVKKGVIMRQWYRVKTFMMALFGDLKEDIREFKRKYKKRDRY